MRLLGLFPRLLHLVQHSDVGAPRYVLDRLPVRRVVHQVVERLCNIVMLELLSLLSVVRNVSRDVRNKLKRIARWTFPASFRGPDRSGTAAREPRSASKGGKSRSSFG